MKLTFDFSSASEGKALGISLHNARVKGHWESNKAGPGKVGGIRPEDSKNNLELSPIKSFSQKDWLGDKKIIGGRQSKAKDSEFTTWVIQAGGINDTLPPEKNLKFLKESHQWLVKKFGANNIMASHIHLDEATPQLQLVMKNVVEVDDNKIYLGMKRTFNYQGLTKTEIRQKAKDLQNEFYTKVASKYGIEAPSQELGSKGKVSQAEWKASQIEVKVEAVKKKLTSEAKLYDSIKEKTFQDDLIRIVEHYNPAAAKIAKAKAAKIRKNKGISK